MKRALFTITTLALLFTLLQNANGAADFDYNAFLKGLRVPPDFKIELVAGEPLVRFPMFACLDDDGRLYVAESSGRDLYAGLKALTRDCRVSRLEDMDGDGRYDKATIFQENVTFPMGLAWRDGKLYLADPPDLVALTDSDGDGHADKREVIVSGFGHTDNGSLHGLTFGPDGLLYFTMGSPDGWKLPRVGGWLEGANGALFRCRTDGSHLEVISRGFVNLVEVEFMPGGEFVATDNWFQRPAGGYRDALVDCAPGGLYPYEPDRGTPLPRTGILLPPITLLPAVAHSGLTRLRGAGFPPEWRSSLFVAQHNTRKVVRHELRREGSTFAATTVDFVVSEAPDFHPSDVLEDADGSLLIVDTGGWYVEHCPTGRIRASRAPGGIYRVRWNRANQRADPWGRSLNWSDLTVAELGSRLRDPRPAVAERAGNEFMKRREMTVLATALDSRERMDTRLRVLWALARLGGHETLPLLRAHLSDSEPTVVCAAARAIAFREDKASGLLLLSLLDSTNASIRRASAEALAVCGARSMSLKTASALATASDDFERHACIVALQALADEPFVRGLLRHDSAQLRRAALNLLDQPPFATLRFRDLIGPLGDGDSTVQSVARGILKEHPSWAVEATPWLRAQLSATADEVQQAALGNLIVTFQANPDVRRLISELLDPAAPTSNSMRVLLLNLLPSLGAKPEQDWLRAVESGLTNATLRVAALNAANAYQRPELTGTLDQLAEEPSSPVAQRLQAARATGGRSPLSDAVFTLALGALEAKAPAIERLAAVELLARARLTADQQLRLLAALRERSVVAPDTLLMALARRTDDQTRTPLSEVLRARLNAGWSPGRSTMEQVLAAFAVNSPARASLLEMWEKNNAESLQRLNEFKPLLRGGDPERGRDFFAMATCSGCHRVGERGGVVGPDLTKIGAIRSGADILESILYPSRSFAQSYEPYNVTLRNGEELSGSLAAQSADGVSLRDGTGAVRLIRAGDIATLIRQETSAMPEGLEQLMSRQQFGDLLAYLQSLK